MDADMRMPSAKAAPKHLGRVLVLGAGVSGRAAAEYLIPLVGNRVESLTVALGDSSSSSDEWARKLAGEPVAFIGGAEEVGGPYDLCIASPGISERSEFYAAGRNASAQIIGEVEFAWRESAAESRWVAVTGTNGKTTTTAMIAHCLRAAGMDAAAVGNIGDTCIEAVAAGLTDVYVVETSSYQLASTVDFAPDAAVMLNITPDHLAWHGSLEAYGAAKEKILANLGANPGAVAVLNAADDGVRAIVRRLKAQSPEERGFSYVPIGAAGGIGEDMRRVCGSDNAAYLAAGSRLTVAFGEDDAFIVDAADLKVKGAHNIVNALACAAACLALGADPETVGAALADFKPLEHRIEPVGTLAGVRFFNDSKATNVDSTLAALDAFAFGEAIVLLGGRDKGTDLTPLVRACKAKGFSVVLYGESAPRFDKAFFDSDVPMRRAQTMADAVACAFGWAKPGQAVLLSPACASFDEFRCFEERGDTFKALVASRPGFIPEGK